jgi:iron complex outermembrane receptor protein
VGANARLKWALGGMTLHSITGYESLDTFSRGDIDGGFGASFLPDFGPGVIPFASETADGIPKHRQLTQEFRLESAGNAPLGWQAGVYLFKRGLRRRELQLRLAGRRNPGRLPAHPPDQRRLGPVRLVDLAGLAGAASCAAACATRATRRARREDYTNSGFVPCVLLAKCTLAELAGQEPDGNLSASPSDSKTNWDLSAVYALNRDVNLFARAATGFRASSVQGAGAFNGKSVAGPETNTSVEAGVKADLFSTARPAGFSAFSYTVKDLQLTAVGGAANANILLNAKKASGQGFELDLTAFLTDHLLASLGVGYNDTKIKDPGLAVAVCAACTVTDPQTGAGGQALIDGNPLPQAPKVTTNFTLRYTRTLAGGDFYVLHRLGLPQQGQLLPLREHRVHRQGHASRVACAWATWEQRQVRGRDLRAQHHQPDAHRRRHRLQQPHRLHQRAAHLGRAMF